MQPVFLYFLQVNLMLSLLYIGYYWGLRKLTFYKLNRIYFLAGAGYALIYPFISFDTLFVEKTTPVLSETVSVLLLPVESASASGVTLLEILFGILVPGILFFLGRFILRLSSLYRIHKDSKSTFWKEFKFRQVDYALSPFSFFRNIYLHQEEHTSFELRTILRHENVHVKNYHTLDSLIFEILGLMNWFNPLVWKMRKEVRQNLEYITDRELLSRGTNRREYQYALAGIAQTKTSHFPGNTFSFKPLKNRVMMMNKKPSAKYHFGKYLFLLPVLVFAGMSFTAAVAQGQMENLTEKAQEITWENDSLRDDATYAGIQEGDPLIVVNGKIYDRANIDIIEPSAIEQVNVLKGEAAIDKYGEKGKHGAVEVTLKEGEKAPVLADGEGTKAFDQYKDHLFLIDGKESSFEEARKLNPSQIQRMGFMEEPGATALYGEKAKNGVVEIVLKKEGEKEEVVDQQALPLYIVDGKRVSVDEANELDPNRVESINVLKDKPATDKYGEEGKNGVVLINLKKSEK